MKTSKPTIAVVTRLSRPAQYLERVLDGLLLQSDAVIYWTLVIQTPLSKEHLACVKRAESHGLIVVTIEAAKGLPLGKLANLGVEATDTEFIMMHDDDDSLIWDFIRSAIELLIDTAFIGAACHAAIINESQERERLEYVLSPGKKILSRSDLLIDNKLASNGLIYRRSVYDASQGYPEDVPVAEDWLLYLDMLNAGDVIIHPMVCSKVYVRDTVSTVDGVGNTDHRTHKFMRERIRSMEGRSFKPMQNSKASLVKIKVFRTLDRFVFSVTGKFLPRFFVHNGFS